MNTGYQKSKILLVDDSSDILNYLIDILGSEYKTIVATNGEKALELLESEEKPDLILLDIIMPGMDGFEVCKRIKANDSIKNIPILFLTGETNKDHVVKAFQMGCKDYITKPFYTAELVSRVQTHLQLYDQNKTLEEKVRIRTSELHNTRLEIIRRLCIAAEYKDHETGMHVIRIGHMCRLIGKALGMSEDDAELLMHASPMHDIGKIGIPDSILQKQGELNLQEMDIMKQHTIIGSKIIGDHHSELLKNAGIIALTHHERWDGTGYPGRLKGEDIPLIGRIVSLADVFDALTSNRPYKKTWSLDKTLDFIEDNKETYFDPDIVHIFFKNIKAIIQIKNHFSDNLESNNKHIHY